MIRPEAEPLPDLSFNGE